jgi:hypothetical protein
LREIQRAFSESFIIFSLKYQKSSQMTSSIPSVGSIWRFNISLTANSIATSVSYW